MKTQSLLSLGIPAQQTLLVFSIILILITKVTQSAREWRKRTNNLKIFNNFASITDKLVLQTINEISKAKKVATTGEISFAIKNKTGRTMNFEKLWERLDHLQEYGFIKLDITLNGNCPTLVWKSLVSL